jgi:lysophospholipase L1-like esterase
MLWKAARPGLVLLVMAGVLWWSATPGSAVTQRSVVIIGDSIINGNRSIVEAALARQAVPSWTFDTKSGRKITTATTINGAPVSSGLDAVDAVRASGVDSLFWVVELGTNNLGMIRNCGCADQAAFARRLIVTMLDRIGDRRVAWVSVRAASHLPESRVFNAALARVADERANVSVIDWFAHSEGRPDWFIDGVHPTLDGARAFADLLAGSVAAIWPTAAAAPCPTTSPTTSTSTSTTSTMPSVPPDRLEAATAVSRAVRLGVVTSGWCLARP